MKKRLGKRERESIEWIDANVKARSWALTARQAVNKLTRPKGVPEVYLFSELSVLFGALTLADVEDADLTNLYFMAQREKILGLKLQINDKEINL